MLWLVFVLNLLCCFCSLYLIEALSQFNLLSSGKSSTSTLGAMTTSTTFAATNSGSWQPIPNNWLLVQTSAGLQAYDNSHSGINKKQQQQQQQKLYGRHATAVTPQHNVVKPYILTFGKFPKQEVSKRESYAQKVSDSFYKKQQQRLAINEANFVVTPTTTTTTSYSNTNALGTIGPMNKHTGQEIANKTLSFDAEAKSSLFPSSSHTSSSPSTTIIRATASQQQTSNKSTTTVGAPMIQDTAIEQRLDDLLMTYKSVFANVKYFFSIVKNVFGVSEANAFKWSKPRQIQGHEEVSSSEETTTTTLSTGTSRKVKKKLKKKLKKFMLPLLLAYKLKFLMLIPLLIGGLILLVGTTGLAGFFFALFTAVMSLKGRSGDAKSFFVQKIQ